MLRFGLIGYPLEHSFSKRYFTDKFEREGIADARYELYPLPDIHGFPELIAKIPDLRGLNVTIPHKQSVIPFLTDLDDTARAIGAVNVIHIQSGGRRTGYNTDAVGFEQTLLRWLTAHLPIQGDRTGLWKVAHPIMAYIVGTGGASKAVAYILTRHGIPFYTVSRTPQKTAGQLGYEDLSGQFGGHARRLWINTTPLGTFPNTDQMPALPVESFNEQDMVYDLVYNPLETRLLKTAAARGAATHNGLQMLHGQAEAAWALWNNHAPGAADDLLMSSRLTEPF